MSSYFTIYIALTFLNLADTTTASIHSSSSAAENATAEAHIKTAIASINSAIVSANSQVKALSRKSFDKRQGSTELATLVENLILDISGALNNVIAQFGLSTLPIDSKYVWPQGYGLTFCHSYHIELPGAAGHFVERSFGVA